MSISAFIKRISVQDFVYWGNPVNDGAGTYTFDPPVQMKCRWEKSREVVKDINGEESLTQGHIWTTEDLDVNAFVMLDSMDHSAYDPDPYAVDLQHLYKIVNVDVIPKIGSANDHVKKYYLNTTFV